MDSVRWGSGCYFVHLPTKYLFSGAGGGGFVGGMRGMLVPGKVENCTFFKNIPLERGAERLLLVTFTTFL